MLKILGIVALLALGGLVFFVIGASPQAGETEHSPASKDSSAKHIDLSNSGLTQIPSHVFDATDTEVLDVSDNALTGAIQAEIRKLTRLTALDAHNNAMTGLPAEIGQLQNLEVLDVSNNKLSGLPYEIGNLKRLKILNISGNPYSPHDLTIIRSSLPTTTQIITD